MFATTPKQIIASTNIGWLRNSLSEIPIIWAKNDKLGNIELSLKINNNRMDSDKYIILSDLSHAPHQGLFEISLICQMIRHSKPHAKIDLFIPYIPYSRHDKKISNKPQALQAIAEFFQHLGFCQIYSLDVHSINYAVKILPNLVNFDSTPYIGKYLKQFGVSNCIIISPDRGRAAQAKQLSLILSCPTITLQKTRKNNISHQIPLKDAKKIKGKNLIIIEDIIDTGQSLNSALRLLNELAPQNIQIVSSFMLNKTTKYKNHITVFGPKQFVNKNITAEIITDILEKI